jgi:hypothetical protein
MRRILSTSLLLSTLLLISISSAQEITTTAVPNLIRYGGALKDASGAPVTAVVGVTFAIYRQQDGGVPLWMETQNVIPDARGNYSVLLGSSTASGLPSDLFSQQEQRWLGVQLQGEPEQARVLLVSVPYAFKAHEAETLGGKSISDFVLAKDSNSTSAVTGTPSNSGASSTQTASVQGNKSSPKLAASQGQTFFSSALTPVVSVMQTGTTPGNNAIFATNSNLTSTSNAVFGQIMGAGRAVYGQALSTSQQAYGVQGDTASTIGVGLLGNATASTGPTYGLKGYSSSTGGTGVRGLSTATTGYTTGVSAQVASAAGIAGVFNNAAGGKILSGQNNGAEKFSVDGGGNATATGAVTANTINSVTSYKIGGSNVVSVGGLADQNLFLGFFAGASNMSGMGRRNVFFGYSAGYNNTTGSFNTFSGTMPAFSTRRGAPTLSADTPRETTTQRATSTRSMDTPPATTPSGAPKTLSPGTMPASPTPPVMRTLSPEPKLVLLTQKVIATLSVGTLRADSTRAAAKTPSPARWPVTKTRLGVSTLSTATELASVTLLAAGTLSSGLRPALTIRQGITTSMLETWARVLARSPAQSVSGGTSAMAMERKPPPILQVSTAKLRPAVLRCTSTPTDNSER